MTYLVKTEKLAAEEQTVDAVLWKQGRVAVLDIVRKMLPCGDLGPAVAEVGVFTGRYARELHRRLRPSRLVLVDAWRQFAPEEYVNEPDMTSRTPDKWAKIEQNVRRKFAAYPEVEVVNELSAKAASGYADLSFDLVYIDANHTYEPVVEDIRAWWPKVKQGGILSGHDYGWIRQERADFPGVRRAVREFVRATGTVLCLTAEPNNASFFIKKQ